MQAFLEKRKEIIWTGNVPVCFINLIPCGFVVGVNKAKHVNIIAGSMNGRCSENTYDGPNGVPFHLLWNQQVGVYASVLLVPSATLAASRQASSQSSAMAFLVGH